MDPVLQGFADFWGAEQQQPFAHVRLASCSILLCSDMSPPKMTHLGQHLFLITNVSMANEYDAEWNHSFQGMKAVMTSVYVTSKLYCI